MKFVMLPGNVTNTGTPTYVQRGDTASFMALPMAGIRVADLGAIVLGGPHPAIVEIDQLVRWFHRVRKWKVTATHPIWGGAINATLELDEALALSEDDAIDEEIVQTAKSGKWVGDFEWTDVNNFDHTVPLTFEILQPPGLQNNFASYYLSGDFTNIIPNVRLRTEFDGVDGNFIYGDTAGFPEGPPAPPNGGMQCLVDGISIDMPAVIETGSGFESDQISFVLEPELYWEYRDENGNRPKWHILTGALL